MKFPLKNGVVVLAGALLLSACGDSEEEVTTATAPVLVPVKVHELQETSWQSTVRTFGVVEALEEVEVAAELSGTVKAVHVSEGDRVEAGQLLLELDSEKRELGVRQARQFAQQAKTALDEARLKLERRRELAEQKTISEEVLDNAKLTVDGAAASFEEALAAQQLAERELADTRIVSPTPGLVDVKAVESGEAVTAGVTLIKLQAVSVLRVHTWVSETDVSHIQPGSAAKVRLTGMPGRTFPARVEWVGVNADRSTGNFPVKLILQQESSNIRPGMTATAVLGGLERPAALLLPEQALVDRERRRVVFVEQDGIARLREPQLAAGHSNRLLILAGLEAGDRIIVSGQHQLVDGSAVAVLDN